MNSVAGKPSTVLGAHLIEALVDLVTRGFAHSFPHDCQAQFSQSRCVLLYTVDPSRLKRIVETSAWRVILRRKWSPAKGCTPPYEYLTCMFPAVCVYARLSISWGSDLSPVDISNKVYRDGLCLRCKFNVEESPQISSSGTRCSRRLSWRISFSLGGSVPS